MKLDINLKQLERQFSLCIRCKQCTYGSWPKNLPTCPIYDRFKFFTYSGGGLIYLARAILLGLLTEENYQEVLGVVSRCTTCGYCGQTCKLVKVAPPYQHVTDLIRLLKINLVKKGAYVSPAHKEAIERVGETKRGFPVSPEEEAGLKILKGKVPDKGEMMIFAGCIASYKDRETVDAVIEILNKSGIHYRMMDEWCCGAPLIDLGDTSGVTEIAEHNIEAIRTAKASRVLFLCPHCQETFAHVYPQVSNKELPFEVVFITKYLKELLDHNQLKVSKPLHQKISYHDPCYLGRYLGDFDSSREILKEVPGVSLVEMNRTREDAYCCGAGGGTRLIDADYSAALGEERLKEFRKTGAEILATSCPLCKSQFRDLSKKEQKGISVRNVVELVRQSLG